MTKHLYFLPGTMCDERLWVPMLQAFEARHKGAYQYHFLTIPSEQTIDEIIEKLNQQLPNEPFTLIGFSLGGYLASAFTVKYPEKIEKLIVLSNMPCALPEKEIKERSRTVAWVKKHGYKGIPTRRILPLLDKSCHSNDDIIETIKVMDATLGGDTLVHQLRATTMRENLFIALANLPVEQYYCVGRNDSLVSIQALENFTERGKKCSLLITESAGHMLPLEKPIDVALRLQEILSDEKA